MPKTESNIYAELIKAAGIKFDGKETFPAFATRLCEKIGAVDDGVFGALSAEAQKWFNASADVINESATKGEKHLDKLPTMSGFPGKVTKAAPAAAAKKDSPKDKAAKEAKAPAAAKKDAKAPAAKKDAKAPAKEKQAKLPGVPEGGKARVDSVAFKMRRAVVMGGPDTTFEQAAKDAGVKGAERGDNAWNAYFNAVQVLRIAAAEKAYKVPAAKA